MDDNLSVNVEGNLDEFKGGEGIQISEDTKYEYASNLETPSIRLEDPGIGKTVLIRAFDFKINPNIKEIPLTKQEIFNHHARQIQTILWADGLKPLEDIAPRVILNEKDGFYHIFVSCEAKLSTVFADTPRPLNQQL